MAAKGVATVGQAGNHREEVLQGEAFGYLQLNAIYGRQVYGTEIWKAGRSIAPRIRSNNSLIGG